MVKNIFVIFLYFFWSLDALTTKSMFLARNHSQKPRFCSHHTIRQKHQRKTKNYKRNAIRSFGYFLLRLVRVLYYNTSYERVKKRACPKDYWTRPLPKSSLAAADALLFQQREITACRRLIYIDVEERCKCHYIGYNLSLQVLIWHPVDIRREAV